MTFDIKEFEYLISLLVSVVLGFAIGYERKLRYKEAGIRTHTIVCLGSALMMVISKYAFGSESDSARIAAQIVAGVGFLGAGIIVYRKNVVHGLTTAAGVWATAGVGMAAGAGMYILAAGATVILILVQCIFHLNFKVFKAKKRYQVAICFTCEDNEADVIKQLFGVTRFYRLTIERQGSEMLYRARMHTVQEFSSTELNKIMQEHSYIRTLERCDDD